MKQPDPVYVVEPKCSVTIGRLTYQPGETVVPPDDDTLKVWQKCGAVKAKPQETAHQVSAASEPTPAPAEEPRPLKMLEKNNK